MFATGNAPSVTATGGDSNIDLSFAGKGVGRVSLGVFAKIQQTAEKVTTEATVIQELLTTMLLHKRFGTLLLMLQETGH